MSVQRISSSSNLLNSMGVTVGMALAGFIACELTPCISRSLGFTASQNDPINIKTGLQKFFSMIGTASIGAFIGSVVTIGCGSIVVTGLEWGFFDKTKIFTHIQKSFLEYLGHNNFHYLATIAGIASGLLGVRLSRYSY